MRVRIKYLMPLRMITGKNEEHVELRESSKIKELLQVLSRKYGEEFGRQVLQSDEEPKKYLIFVLNGKVLNEDETLTASLKDNDDLSIVPIVGGG